MKGRGGLLSFSLLMRPRHFFFRPSSPHPKQNNNNNNNKTGACYAGYDWPYSGTFMRRSKRGKSLAVTDHAGAGEMKVCPSYTDSSTMSSKMRKSRHLRKFHTMINSSMRKLHYGPLTLRRTNVHLDSCSLTIAHTLLPGDHCSLLSLGGC